MKIDAVPGHRHAPARHAEDASASYPVVCAELCGLGHAVMRQTAHVVEPAEFDTLARRSAPRGARPAAAAAATRPAAAAARARRQGGLHRRAAAAAATRWPTPARPAAPAPTSTRCLTGKDEAFIEQTIVDPNAEIAQGFRTGIMPPNYGDTLQPAELDALVKYLAEVTRVMEGRR